MPTPTDAEPGDDAEETGSDRRPSRRIGIVIAAALATLLVVYLVLVLVARSRVDPGRTHPFFEPRAGEHEPLVFAHQGGELIRPSNTMVAFTHAADLGVDVLDTDMHRTADGVLVLLHDETVDRTSDGTGAVRDLTLDELRQLDFGHTFTTDDGATYPYRGRGLGIVTVEELFTTFDDGTRFGIEIKQTGPEAATELCRTIQRFGYEDRVLVSSFAQPNLDVFRTACPTVATSATEGEVIRFYLAHRLGLNGLVRPAFDALQVPEASSGLRIVSDGFVESAGAWGIPVVPWTINEPDDLDRMIELDVDGINTDVPDRLLERLS